MTLHDEETKSRSLELWRVRQSVESAVCLLSSLSHDQFFRDLVDDAAEDSVLQELLIDDILQARQRLLYFRDWLDELLS